jgi:ABC-2 type transport system permease protein
MTEGPVSGSSIYDLGYRSYDGPRAGRWSALQALYVSSVRAAFGLGRRTSSKIVPFGLAILAFVPALIQLGVGAITSGVDANIDVFEHHDYFGYVQIVLVLFAAAVAPELAGRDQRNRTLSLYFSRSLSRVDYVAAKLAALTSAMLVLTLGPQLVLFVGNGMSGDDLGGYLGDRWDLVLPIVAGSLLVSTTIASVGLVLASYIPRRSFATAAIIGVFVLTLAVANILMESVDAAYAQYALLVSPAAWEGAILWLFGEQPGADDALRDATFGGAVYLLAALATIVVAAALSLRRFLRVQA